MARTAIPDWARQVAKFLFVGGSAAAIDFGVLSGFVALGLSPYLARIISVAVATVYTWLLNRRLTFATAAPPSWREFGRYIAVAMAGIALNLTIYWSALYLGAPTWAAFVLGTGVTAVFSYFRYKAVLS